MHGQILVVGSSNTDMVIKANKFPLPGETVLGGDFFMNPGGKGANQAVTCARLGAQVTFVTRVGNDIFGRQALKQFQKEKIENKFVIIDSEYPSGVALIIVDEAGENCISVAPGSNGQLKPSDLEEVLERAEKGSVLLMQLEIPLETVEEVIKKSHAKGLRILLNPAPAQNLSPELFSLLYLITPNESEAELLTGIKVKDAETARRAAQRLEELGAPNVVITLGAKGAYLHNASVSKLIEATKVTAVDTTAAGDCFNGALAVALSENQSLEEAVTFACKVSSISVTRMGAQSSIPYRKEVGVNPPQIQQELAAQ